MALSLYDAEQEPITSIRFVNDGSFGDCRTKLFFLKNDSANHYYETIVLSLPNAEYSAGYMRNGYSIKLFKGASEPSMTEWLLVGPGESIQLDDIGEFGAADTTNYHPFYMMVCNPANQPVGLIEDVDLRITYIERLAS